VQTHGYSALYHTIPSYLQASEKAVYITISKVMVYSLVLQALLLFVSKNNQQKLHFKIDKHTYQGNLE
jgi:hypothetical protein